MARGGVSQVFLNNDGFGYTSVPTVTFSAPESETGVTATAVAITTSVGNVQSVERIDITNAGLGYTVAPTITISGGGGTGAAATCSINQTTEFNINRIRIDNEGLGYSVPPAVTIVGSVGSGGTTAIGVASISSDGKLNAINLTRPGAGYSEAPSINIAGFSTIGFGTFVYNELVTGQSSGTTGRVRDFRTIVSVTPGIAPVTNLRVSLNTGKFSTGEVIVGSISSAKYVVRNYDDESYDNPYDVNKEIETEADNILDFTESNPFGNY
tara:strand:- start:33 stop:836 length:804 start_codon:yes stop_codon:yes gene_type:complete